MGVVLEPGGSPSDEIPTTGNLIVGQRTRNSDISRGRAAGSVSPGT